jgi:cardiolipin synthase (CMP-forming)
MRVKIVVMCLLRGVAIVRPRRVGGLGAGPSPGHHTLSVVTAEDPATTVDPVEGLFDNVWTVPNAFTLVRLLCLPLFLYLLFGLEERAAAAWLLGGLGATDWVDGYLARRLGQVSEFGKVFDPTVDRVLFIVALTAIMVDGSMPLWFGIVLLLREVCVGAMMAIATLVYGIERIDVTWWGKVATFLLMFAVPGFLMGSSDITGAAWFEAAAWALGVPGLALSLWTGFAYIPKVRAAIDRSRAQRGSTSTATSSPT